MGITDRLREEVEAVPPGRELIGGYFVPTKEEGDPHDRITRLEGTALALYQGLMFLAREMEDLSQRLDRLEQP